MSDVIFSVVICTHNRANLLGDALHSVLLQDYPSSRYEVIVVDNASTDDTFNVIDSYKQQFNVRLRYVYESRLGLSYSRNSGAKVAQGEIIAYLDDDAIAARKWIEAISSAFSTISSTKLGIVGGKVDLLWEIGSRPSWLSCELDGYLAATSLPYDSPSLLPAEMFPVGANLCIKKSCLEKVGGFSTDLGRQGNKLLSNEEVRLCDQVRRVGYEIWYTPEAVVQHRVPPERSTMRYLLARTYWQGVSDAAMSNANQNTKRTPFWRSTLGFARDLLGYAVRGGTSALTRHYADAFSHACFASSRIGYYICETKTRVGAR